MEEIKSSPIKAEPSPFHATPPKARAMLESMILDTYTWFANLVKTRRGYSDTDAEGLLDGSVFTGRQALEHKLIDAIGDEETARKWLVDQKQIDDDLAIVEWSLDRPAEEFFLARAMVRQLAAALGLSGLVSAGEQLANVANPAQFDGFLSIWQVGNNHK